MTRTRCASCYWTGTTCRWAPGSAAWRGGSSASATSGISASCRWLARCAGWRWGWRRRECRSPVTASVPRSATSDPPADRRQLPGAGRRRRPQNSADDAAAHQLGRGEPQPGGDLRHGTDRKLEYRGAQLRGRPRRVAAPGQPQVGRRRQREAPARHTLADHHRSDRYRAGRDRDEQLSDRRADPGRLVAGRGRRTRRVNQGEYRPAEACGQPEEAGSGPEAGRGGPLAGLGDIGYRGATVLAGTTVPAEATAQPVVHTAAAVAADLEGRPEVGGQPAVGAGTLRAPGPPDLRPAVLHRTVGGVSAGRPGRHRRAIGGAAPRPRCQQPEDRGDLPAQLVLRR